METLELSYGMKLKGAVCGRIYTVERYFPEDSNAMRHKVKLKGPDGGKCSYYSGDLVELVNEGVFFVVKA
jgi:hypothetical protein